MWSCCANKPVKDLVALQQIAIHHSDGIREGKVEEYPHDPVGIKLKEILVRAGDQLSDASAAPVGEVSKGHAGGTVGEESLVNVTLVGVIVADEPRHAVETFRLVLAEVE